MYSQFLSVLLCFSVISAGHHSKTVYYYTVRGQSGNETEVVVRKAEEGHGGSSWVARGYFDNKINRTGFGYLEVETNMAEDSLTQAYHAGYLEAFLTADLIFSRWYNTVRSWCIDDRQNCERINAFVANNTRWITEQLKLNGNHSYWYQLQLLYGQLYGMQDGYNQYTKHEKLGWSDILWLNIINEVGDIQLIVNNHSSTSIPESGDHSSALVKIMPDVSDIYFGHVTWGDYTEMLRILKRYVFRYRRSQQDSELVPGYEMSLSSYPGAILSIDDFYLLSSGLAVMETTNAVYNTSLFKGIRAEGIVWEGLRAMVANRLATDGHSWHSTFGGSHNSGTYNNQWMVLDYNKLHHNDKVEPGALWVSEQLPHHFFVDDVTQQLIGRGYWSSYNIPYFEQVYQLSGYADMLHEKGSWYSYSEAPRARIFARDQHTVHDMDSFMALMRSNDFTKDPFARCNCSDQSAAKQRCVSASGAIAARKDLNPAAGEGVQRRQSSGATDAKLTNSQLFRAGLRFLAISGPTTGTDAMLPVFKWSESPFRSKTHLSLPDEFNFHPVTVKWRLAQHDNTIPLPT